MKAGTCTELRSVIAFVNYRVKPLKWTAVKTELYSGSQE